MPTTIQYGLNTDLPETPQASPSSPASPGSVVSLEAVLGSSVARPFRRDGKGDFARLSGGELLSANLGQILGTLSQGPRNRGEIRWCPEFGSQLMLLRHQNNDEGLVELAKVEVVAAIERWEPRVRVRDVLVERLNAGANGKLNVLKISIQYDLVKGKVSVAKGLNALLNIDLGG